LVTARVLLDHKENNNNLTTMDTVLQASAAVKKDVWRDRAVTKSVFNIIQWHPMSGKL